MPYRLRYRLSIRFNRSHGNPAQSWQNRPVRSLHMRIRQFTRDFGRFCSASRHPWHGFFGRRYALQTPQFIPHGAMSVSSNAGELIGAAERRGGHAPRHARRTRTEFAWAWRPSASAMVSTVSPIASRPAREMICTVDALVKWLTLSPE
jgi:hypothetical protein